MKYLQSYRRNYSSLPVMNNANELRLLQKCSTVNRTIQMIQFIFVKKFELLKCILQFFLPSCSFIVLFQPTISSVRHCLLWHHFHQTNLINSTQWKNVNCFISTQTPIYFCCNRKIVGEHFPKSFDFSLFIEEGNFFQVLDQKDTECHKTVSKVHSERLFKYDE